MNPIAEHDDLPPALRDRLRSDDAGIRRVALIALADEEDEAGLPWLIDALSDPAFEVRTEAAQRLAGWETQPVVEALGRALHDDASTVREAAALSLAELKDPATAPWLLPLSVSSHAFACATGLRALRELRSPEAAAPAMDSLKHPDATVRREAIGVLGWLKHREALAALAQLAMHDSEADVRRAATGALGMSDGSTPSPLSTQAAPHPAVQQALLAGLHDDAWPVREEAASTVGKLRLHDAAAALITALADGYWQVRLRAARALGQLRASEAIGALGQTLTHEISNLRKEAAIALGDIGETHGQAVLPLLRAAEADADPEVRKVVRLALSRIKQ